MAGEMYDMRAARLAVKAGEDEFMAQRVQAANEMAEVIVGRPTGAADLDEYVFAMHGIDRSAKPADEGQEWVLAAYDEIEQKFMGRQNLGLPVARMSQCYTWQGEFSGEGDPLWVGRIAADPSLRIHRREEAYTSYIGSIVLPVARVHSSAAIAKASPAYRSEVGNFNDPGIPVVIDDMDVELSRSGRSKGVFDDRQRTMRLDEYAVGWGDIITRRRGLEYDKVYEDTVRFLGRVIATMEDFGLQPDLSPKR